jgi:serine/threonine protein kinase
MVLKPRSCHPELSCDSEIQVTLVRSKQDGQYFAMKILKKKELLSKREAAFFMEEKESLILGRNSEWLTRLHASFQDESAVYLVMEYLAGGSLKSYIESCEEPIDESDAKFYAAEMILAIDEVHRLGFIHR